MRFISILVLVAILAPLASSDAQERFGRGGSRYQSQINALGSSPVATLPIPVLFGVAVGDLTQNFGDPRGGGARSHEGLDILAPEGTPIASPTDAVVVRTGDGANSGLYVRTANPGGEQFVYMHLSKVAEGVDAGDAVQRGDIIGFVGNTGNASGGPAHLHFEIRKGGALDPFPRLTTTFSAAEREESIREAQAKGIVISASALARAGNGAPAASPPAPPSSASAPVAAALAFGETNTAVKALQSFLIAANSGSASARLANTGATGYFGALTQEALKEYQRAAGIAASGVMDTATYTQIFALQGEGDSSETEEEGIAAEPAQAGSAASLARDLEFGMTHSDVRVLQQFLNAQGFLVSAAGAGSPGSETDYFGEKTRSALAKYQAAHAITPSAGYFGPKTRAFVALR